MITVIVFSKDRPLQLQAYLDSLMYYSEIKSEDIYVLYKETPEISYQTLIKQCQDINWVKETIFFEDLQNILEQAKDFILWGVDDIFFKSAFDINTCIRALNNDQDVFAFNLWLGKNIQPTPHFCSKGDHLTWNWVETHFPERLEWDYPWEIAGSVYRKIDILNILQIFGTAYNLHNPNYLKGQIAAFFAQKRNIARKYLACFDLAKCCVLTVNRVQDTHPNPFDSRLKTDPQSLYRYFNEGYKLNYRKFENCQNLTPQVDSSYFDLIKPEIQALSCQPLVSVICPTYNGEAYIEETIISVLQQTFTNFEFIILDDGSTDNTRQIIQKYQHDSRIKYFYQENIGRQGIGETLNCAINKSRGELICYIGHDDICLPDRLEKQVAQFRNDPELDLCFSDGFHIDAQSNLRSGSFRYEETFSVNSFNLLRTLFRKNIIPAPTVMYKRSFFESLGGSKPNAMAEDYDLWLRAAPYFNFKFIDEKLIKYRFHEKSLSTSSANAKNMYSSTINILIETRQKYSIFDLYPEIYRCQIRHQALYSAYLDFGNTMLTANVPVVEIAVKEYQKALKHFQGVEALNNLAIALYSAGEQQESLKLFEHLANHFGHVEIVQHNLNIVNALMNGQQLSQANFALLTQSPENSELLQIIEEFSVKNHPESSIVAKPIQLSKIESISNQSLILLYSDDPYIYGAAQCNQALLKGLASLNKYQLTCAQSKVEHYLITEREQLGIQHAWVSYDTSGQGFGRTLVDTEDAARIFNQIKPDFIFFSDCSPISNLAAKQVAIQQGIPFISIVHFVAPYLAERFANYLEQLSQIYQNAKAIIAVSQENLDLLHSLFRLPQNKGQVIYNGRPKEYFAPVNLNIREQVRSELNIPANAIVCFTAARLETVKGYQYQLEAIKQLKNQPIWSDLYFIWAGAGSLKEQLNQEIHTLNIAKQVKLLGERTDIPNLLDASDIFILPSELEGMPLTVMEAMAKGLPVIASAVSGVPEELGETGQVIPDPKINPQATIQSLVTTLQDWVKNPSLLCSIGEACKQRAEQLFKEERMIQETILTIEQSIQTNLPKVPLVSVIIPCYKQAHFLSESVASVVSQLFEDWEIIIVNDGSPDNTSEVAQQLIKTYHHKQIRLIEKENGGLSSARNAGIKIARGKYILPLDADDKLDLLALSHLVRVAQNQDSPSVCFGSYLVFGNENKLIISADLYSPKNITKFNMLVCTSLFYKKVWEMVGGYRENMKEGFEDWDFWLNCHKHKIPFFGTREVVFYYRRRLDSMLMSESEKKRPKLEAQLVCSYPELYDHDTVEKARDYLKTTNDDVLQPQSENQQKWLTQQWLEISEENLESAFSGELGNKHRELLASGIKQQLLLNEEKQFIVESNQYIAKGWKQDKIAQHFLAASLYCYPHQLPEKWFENAEVPEFLVDYFVNFMFETPSFFKELDEADQYYHYVKGWVNFLHLCITTETDSPTWQQMAWIFTQRANFIPLYFNSENLKEIYVKRAEIMEIALKQRGFQIDFNFPKRDQNRKKIRIGILSNHFTPLTETFSSLPIFEYLDRGFEIILYTNMISGHPLEQYCESRVDRLVQLPEDLNAGVQIIRQDDLDFLFICTNTTAVTNQITILALHKLARVQIATFNSPVTTGMKNIDYYLTGKLTEFENSDHYSEKLLLVNGQGYCFNYGDNQPKPTQIFTRQLFDIKEDQTVFISAANFYKLTPELKETWVKILAKVDNSVLILMPFGQSWSNQYPKESLVKSLHLLFEKYDISIDRLKLFDPLPNRIEVREALKIADVYLDSYPYSGTTSLIEPLEIGLPSVVRKGNTLRNRMGAAMLQSIGLDELVVQDEESYINLAVKLGTDEKLRNQYREQILEKMANNPPFLDSKAYSAQIGDVLKQLFTKHI